jgi:hypothetical protein
MTGWIRSREATVGNDDLFKFEVAFPIVAWGEPAPVAEPMTKRFDFKIPNGGASDRSVQIVTDDPDEEIIFAFENLDAIANFLKQDTGFPMGR